jgi:hypothetical protein
MVYGRCRYNHNGVSVVLLVRNGILLYIYVLLTII